MAGERLEGADRHRMIATNQDRQAPSKMFAYRDGYGFDHFLREHLVGDCNFPMGYPEEMPGFSERESVEKFYAIVDAFDNFTATEPGPLAAARGTVVWCREKHAV